MATTDQQLAAQYQPNTDLGTALRQDDPTLNAQNNPVMPVAQAMPSPAAPDISGTPQAPGNVLSGGAAPPAPAGTPSVWKNIAMGAIWGLAGSAGAKHFGAGLAGGASGVLQGAQQERENANKQQQLQFESVRAADSHIVAMAQAKEADAATEEHKLQLDAFKANIDAFNKAMGITPALTVQADNSPDMHAQATGGLQTLASRNGGTIPAVVTVNSAATSKDPNHSVDVYSKPTAQELQNNPNGYRKLVDIASVINNGSPTTDDQWNTGNFAMKPGAPQQGMQMLGQKTEGQAQMVLAAQQRLYGVPPVSGNTAKDAATSATLKQQLDSYSKRSDANPQVVKLLQSQLETFDSAAKDARGKQNQAASEEEQAKLNVQNSPENIQASANKAAAEETAKQNASNNMMFGSMPDGTQVAGTAEQLQALGASGITKLSSTEGSKVLTARQLISPAGLISNVEKDIAAFKPDELNAAAARWNEYKTGKIGAGADPRFVTLRTDAKLLSTALMQAHVGSRGSEDMMEHFNNLADAGKMDGATLKAAIAAERAYVTEKAMMPKTAANGGMPQGATMKVPGSDGKMHWSDGKQDLGVVQ